MIKKIFSEIDYKIKESKRISKEEGIVSLFKKLYLFFINTPIRYTRDTFSSVVIFFKPKKFFSFKGKKLQYLYHRYNTTWKNERIVEIPIAIRYLKENEGKRILEFGDVLSHYYPAKWEILDKYVRGKNIINEDVINFNPVKKYDFIISISTLEHVGFDEEDKDPYKIIKAIKNIKENCLNKCGKAIITMPLGYNMQMDKLLFSNKLNFNKKYFMKRINKKNEWKEVLENEVKNSQYGSPFKAANAIVIGIISN